ncbi:glycoside hydrolase family 3 N-terminal domain-containing protein [Leptolyngbya sp. PCC 6406]|uniref:glycoside hydrolase family 3 N-terminal domain-containing protein n=1 Tax=Leptolyngbya sp. PCC 6406 TaxID=1173264 RepID=UPI0002AC3661|nr:glycoside hydrolase family 3 N-terminal domain-containing protein [Leptolyngbya sp. PCC 6406]
MGLLGLPSPDDLSLAGQVAQLVVVRASGMLFDHQRRYPQWELANADLHTCIADLGVGGVILLGGSAPEVGVRVQQLQDWATVPLLMAADIEEGVGQRFTGATAFPPPLALGAIGQRDLALACQYAQAMGAATAQEAQAIGLNWLVAPVVDVNNNPENPVINVRAFGETPDVVSALIRAFLTGAQEHPVLTTAKHFPGHGDTAVDSHLHLPLLPHDRDRLTQVELAPFATAIAAGVDTVMTAHLQVPALDPDYPATLSPALLSGLLRRELGFDGLIVTDALVMGAITQHYGPYEAAVLALEAGVDVLLMPVDPVGTIEAVCEAVRMGRLSPERILTSVERIWRAKQKVATGLSAPPDSGHAWEHLLPPPVQLDQLAQPAAQQLARHITRDSMQVRDCVSPCAPQARGVSLVLVDDVLATDWLSRRAPAIALPEQYGYTPRLLDVGICSASPGSFPPRPTLLQIFSRGNPFRGTAGVGEFALSWFRALRDVDCLVGVVVYGSPYTLDILLPELPDTVPYGFAYGQMPSAQEILLTALLGAGSATSPSQAFTD